MTSNHRGPLTTQSLRNFCYVSTLFLVSLQGCGSPDSESSANQKLQAEINKWMAGEKSEASTMESRVNSGAPPVGYQIKSVVGQKARYIAHAGPDYRFNIDVEYKSEAGTPLHKVTTYALIWDPRETKWLIEEKF